MSVASPRRLLTVAVVALIALAGCGESPEDQAREDGERLGEAVRALYDADSLEAAQAAADEVAAAREQIGEDAADLVGEQAQVQADSIERAADAWAEAQTATDPDEVEDARNELRSELQNIRAQADAFQNQDDSVANQFWRGFEDGFDGD